MKKHSILSLSTFFLISSINASAPAPQPNSTSSTSAASISTGKPLPPVTVPGKIAWQNSNAKLAANSSPAASKPGASNIVPTLDGELVFVSLSSQAQVANNAAQAPVQKNSNSAPATQSAPAQASSSKTKPVEELPLVDQLPLVDELPPIELNNLGFSKLDNWRHGTDQTVLTRLRALDEKQKITSKMPESQLVLASVVSNFKKRAETPEKVQDVLDFMTLVKRHKIKIDQAARRSLREYLATHEDKQETNLLLDYAQKVEALKASYELQTKSMQKTEAARHLTYQSESDNEEEVRVYKPTQKLMAFTLEELVTKKKPENKNISIKGVHQKSSLDEM